MKTQMKGKPPSTVAEVVVLVTDYLATKPHYCEFVSRLPEQLEGVGDVLRLHYGEKGSWRKFVEDHKNIFFLYDGGGLAICLAQSPSVVISSPKASQQQHKRSVRTENKAQNHRQTSSLPCSVCHNLFPSERQLRKHLKEKHITESDIDAPVDEPGSWVSREILRKRKTEYKSFGIYECSKGCSVWVSAHSQINYKQACKKCEEYSYPRFMWVNDKKRSNEEEKNVRKQDKDKPHDKTRCEACQRGKCTLFERSTIY